MSRRIEPGRSHSLMGLHNRLMETKIMHYYNGMCSEVRWFAPEITLFLDGDRFDPQDVLAWFKPYEDEDMSSRPDDEAYWLWTMDDFAEAQEVIKKDPNWYENSQVTTYDAQTKHYGALRQTVLLFMAAIFGELDYLDAKDNN